MSTYSSLHCHLVFSNKHRTNFIHRSWEKRLHEYLGGIVKSLDGYPQGVGGVEDHVHLLIGLKPTQCISDFVRELKKGSSVWVHDVIKQVKFTWQESYSVFSVSANSRGSVQKYIGNQHEHHRVKSYREELADMLDKAGVQYDPKYLE